MTCLGLVPQAKLRHAELVYVVRRMMIRMAERSGERWMRKLENGSLQSETMSQSDLDKAMHSLKLQVGHRSSCPCNCSCC